MKARTAALSKIDELYDNNCLVCPMRHYDNNEKSYCIADCPISNQLRNFGEQLLATSHESANKLLAKGKGMTYEEIIFLNKEKGIPQKQIAAAMGVHRSTVERKVAEYKMAKEQKGRAV